MRFYLPLLLMMLSGCAAQKSGQKFFDSAEIDRIVKTLASDEMEGRASFTPGIEKAADFIAAEFKDAGLEPFNGDYRQSFTVNSFAPQTAKVVFDGKELDKNQVFFTSRVPSFEADQSTISTEVISAQSDFMTSYRKLMAGDKNVLIVVDPVHQSMFSRLQQYISRGSLEFDQKDPVSSTTKIFVLADKAPQDFKLETHTSIEKRELFNVVGKLPGKSKEKELVVFSAHYDHIGIQKAVDQDSIANGADDDASGVTAVISLAQAYAKSGGNERTLIFVAFTAEEIGGFGSQYFSQEQPVEDIMAMINIEMIGKDSKFGPNSMYITGYEHSDLGKIMQNGVEGSSFSFHPDPYPEQNLFYRSDNASLAMLGVPAHTFSTVQIVNDQYYHTVKDEYETLNVKNIESSIRAIYEGAEALISGEATPIRVEKLSR